jgi:hypothetical protein
MGVKLVANTLGGFVPPLLPFDGLCVYEALRRNEKASISLHIFLHALLRWKSSNNG